MNAFLFVLLLLSFQLLAGDGMAQKVTVKYQSAKLIDVLHELERQTGFTFFFFKGSLDMSKPVNVSCDGCTLTDVLDRITMSQPFSYEVQDKTIVLTARLQMKAAEVLPTLSDTSQLGKLTVTGRVTDTAGIGLPGATIFFKYSGKGTMSDSKGNFTISGIDPNDLMTISYTGFNSSRIRLNGRTKFEIAIMPAVSELDKVVIQGYGTTSKRIHAGNIGTVTAEEIQRQVVVNPLQALQGKVPGLVVTQTSGYASAPIRVELRGRSTINPSLIPEPLYIIDGVPLTILSLGAQNYKSGSKGFTQNEINGPANGQSPIYSISPSDIESISILKDADATAIYGSRGGNGVIIITTKKGKSGKTKFDVSAFKGVNVITKRYELLNTSEYIMMRKEAFANDGFVPQESDAYDFLVWDTTRYTNWQSEFWNGTQNTFDVNASVSGGEKGTSFRLSGTFHNQNNFNTISGQDWRATVQFNVQHESINKRFSLAATAMYSQLYMDLLALGGGVLLPPNAPAITTEGGALNYIGWEPASSMYPFSAIREPYRNKTSLLNSNVNLRYKVIDGLVASTSLGYSNNRLSQKSTIPIASQNPNTNPTGRANFGTNAGTRVIVEPQLEYTRMISKAEVKMVVGGTYQSTEQDGYRISGTGYVNDKLLNSIINAAEKDASDVAGEYKYNAVFGRLNLIWANKYVIDASGRRDGSSRFGQGNRFGNFGAIGLAWIFSEENFLRSSNILSFGKLRFSAGKTGSDLIGDYAFLTRWQSRATYNGIPAYTAQQHANPELQWQVDKKLEFGLQLGFIEDRILFEISVYRNRIGNQLVQYLLPTATGFSYVTANTPAKVQNTGFEPMITAKIIKTKDVSWDLAFNVGINRNKLLEFPGLESSPYARQFKIGEPLNIRRLLRYIGVDPQTGQYQYDDINKDGAITYTGSFTPDEDVYYKDMSVQFDGGFGTEFRYKGFTLNAFFQFRKQNGASALASIGPGGVANNISKKFLGRWQKPGDITEFARFTTQPNEKDYLLQYSDRAYTDASFIRLNNLSLMYNLGERALRRLLLKNGSIFLRGQNLFTISKYDGIDPETQVFGGMPPVTAYTAGIQFSF
ncbi:SusC/RagA family TonB-linked outer membrane protein [Chitinophaga rhizosphaerae]|uniref:SusC/RagA family TonB-linked outer membrane protein n=1 Tax=Chitinophaga rhizosphaerae TaxID=1864947 RepID=UPI0013E0CF35|nr:SusC/RagA family TonB-linked outer membrane protein [Chitinophaga rhizosphaerae]